MPVADGACSDEDRQPDFEDDSSPAPATVLPAAPCFLMDGASAETLFPDAEQVVDRDEVEVVPARPKRVCDDVPAELMRRRGILRRFAEALCAVNACVEEELAFLDLAERGAVALHLHAVLGDQKMIQECLLEFVSKVPGVVAAGALLAACPFADWLLPTRFDFTGSAPRVAFAFCADTSVCYGPGLEAFVWPAGPRSNSFRIAPRAADGRVLELLASDIQLFSGTLSFALEFDQTAQECVLFYVAAEAAATHSFVLKVCDVEVLSTTVRRSTAGAVAAIRRLNARPASKFLLVNVMHSVFRHLDDEPLVAEAMSAILASLRDCHDLKPDALGHVASCLCEMVQCTTQSVRVCCLALLSLAHVAATYPYLFLDTLAKAFDTVGRIVRTRTSPDLARAALTFAETLGRSSSAAQLRAPVNALLIDLSLYFYNQRDVCLGALSVSRHLESLPQ